MEQKRGVERGSYIWGWYVLSFHSKDHCRCSISSCRSVHNTCIERLWYDVTHGYGQKWKEFFLELETHHGLNPTNPAHIWLLHHLFLPTVNEDAQEWAETWNSHPLTLPRGEGTRSPREIFFFSMLQDELRGPLPVADPEEAVADPATYGIDWDVAANTMFMNHLLKNNPQDWEDDNPFATSPSRLSYVPCDAPNCPMNPQQILDLDAQLAMWIPVHSRSMIE